MRSMSEALGNARLRVLGDNRAELPPDPVVSSWLSPQVTEVIRNGAPFVLAAATWISLSPYFVWGSIRWTIAATVVVAVVAASCWVAGARLALRSPDAVGVGLISLFLIYISLEPRLDGGHTRWVYVLPSLLALAMLSTKQRQRCLYALAAIFAITLVPGILDSLWLAAGFPQTFGEVPVPNAAMAAHGVRFLTSPGALFIESNSAWLPWGGVLFRLSAIYDEPGTVGTNAALLLVALRFRASDWRVSVLYLGGILSFSLAFAALAALGLLAYSVIRRRPVMLVAIIPVIAAASMALGSLQISVPVGTRSHIAIAEATHASSSNPLPSSPTNQGTHTFAPTGPGLRQTQSIDNRSLAPMTALFSRYRHAGPKTLMFGIASDASVVLGGGSQVWTRVLTDHGILGFVLLFGGVSLLGFGAWRRSGYTLPGLLFLGLYALNIYQRPVVWLPYALLLLICGPAVASIPDRASDSIRRTLWSRHMKPRTGPSAEPALSAETETGQLSLPQVNSRKAESS